jgi:HAD superfamily hydrolase (TIGR01509 family)
MVSRVQRGLIFDCDGVLADTERFGHLPAFNQMFAEFGLPVRWSEAEYGVKLAIGGGKERMASLLTPTFVTAAQLPDDTDAQRDLVATWHKRKTEIYTEMVAAGRLPGRPGIRRVVAEAHDAGWALACASTSAEPSVRAVLEHAVGTDLAAEFLVLAGDVVPHKKPAPDIYTLALERLALRASACLVVEDSRNGLEAATGAGISCLVTVNDYTKSEDFSDAVLVVSSLGDPDGEHTVVLANHSRARVGDWITVETLADLVGVDAFHNST